MTRNKTWIYIIGVFLLFSSFPGCGKRAGEREYKQAMAAWRAGDLVQARTLLEKSNHKISGGERKADILNWLGVVLWKLQEPDQAITAFRNSCRISPAITGANVNLGAALFHAGELESAEFELTKTLNDQPENRLAAAYLSMVYLQNKEWEKASGNLKNILRQGLSDPALFNALTVSELNRTGDAKTAVANFKNLLAKYPDYAPASYNLAALYEHWLNAPQVQSTSAQVQPGGCSGTSGKRFSLLPAAQIQRGHPGIPARHLL